MKLEKITLWTSTETYGMEPELGALDYIIPNLYKLENECIVLEYESEDYKLAPVKKSKREKELRQCIGDCEDGYFIPRRTNQVYCSKKCQNKTNVRKHRERQVKG